MTIRTPVSVSTDVVRVEFELADSASPFIGLSMIGDCEIELQEILPRQMGGYTGFYSIRGGDPEQLVERAAMYEGSDARVLGQAENGSLLQLTILDACPAMFLAERGAFPREVSAVAGVGRITAELVPEFSNTDVADAFLAAYPSAKLLSQRQQSYYTPLFSHREFEQAIEDVLTDRQRDALEAAYNAGYYEWPRDTSAEEVAETMGISAATFTQHLREAERKLVTLLFK